jgi:CheY-like chemotaxis protein
MTLSSSVLAGRALVEISYRSQETDWARDAETGVLSEGVCRGIVRSHGGEIRLVRLPPATCRFELELPLAPAQPGAGVETRVRELLSTRPLTVLLVEPDESVRQNTVALLSQRSCRVVPASSAEQGSELVERLAFDLVFCSIRLPGLGWFEFFERVRARIAAFVLLTEGFDAELSRTFQNGDAYVLAKPVAEPELDRVLMAAGARRSLVQSA